MACVWCESHQTCKEGGFYGIKKSLFTGCSDWRWGQCKVNGKYLLAGVAGGTLALGILLTTSLCFCFCCCRKKRRSRGYARLAQGEELDVVSSWKPNPRSETQQRKNEFYKKWGTPEERAARRDRFNAILQSTRTTPEEL